MYHVVGDLFLKRRFRRGFLLELVEIVDNFVFDRLPDDCCDIAPG